MNNPFGIAWLKTGRAEAGYSNNPNDAGGETNWGITARVARANGYAGDMRELPKELATEIAKKQYWDILKLDEIAALNDGIALEMFDTGINCGQEQAGKFLQRALNIFNRQQKDYWDVKDDGLIGGLTLDALRSYLSRRGRDGITVMLRALNSQQGQYYMDIGVSRVQNEDFEFGWFLNRVII